MTIVRCVFCTLGQPERCTGFVGAPTDGPRGEAVYECGIDIKDPADQPLETADD